jgi:hypothetical protein
VSQALACSSVSAPEADSADSGTAFPNHVRVRVRLAPVAAKAKQRAPMTIATASID